MQPQKLAQLLLHQMSALDEVIGAPISQSIPAKILLHMFVEENSSNRLNQHVLNSMISAPTSTLERYVQVLVSEGLIETSLSGRSEQAELSLSASIKRRLETIFHPSE